MNNLLTSRISCGSILVTTLLASPGMLRGQTGNLPAGAPPNVATPINWTAAQDHKNMMDQLGIIRLRPGPSGQPGATNSANYDPAKANPFPDLPETLTRKNGQKVTSAEMWWKQRRPEIVEDFEREVVGRVPNNVPGVTWTVISNITDGLVGNLPANGKRLVGHVDNSACPAITVDIRMTVVTPVKAKGPVPVLMMFGGFGGDGMPRPAGSPVPTNRFPESAARSKTLHLPSNCSGPLPSTLEASRRTMARGNNERHHRPGQQRPAPQAG